MDFLINLLHLNTTTIPVWVLGLFAVIGVHVVLKFRLRRCQLRQEVMQLRILNYLVQRLGVTHLVWIKSQTELHLPLSKVLYTITVTVDPYVPRSYKPTVDPIKDPVAVLINRFLRELCIPEQDIHFYHGAEFYNRDVFHTSFMVGTLPKPIRQEEWVDRYHLSIRIDKGITT